MILRSPGEVDIFENVDYFVSFVQDDRHSSFVGCQDEYVRLSSECIVFYVPYPRTKQLLNGTNTYYLLDTDPTAELEKKINEALKRLQELQRITKEECWKMRALASNAAPFYGLPNAHKESISLIPTVSFPGTAETSESTDKWTYSRHFLSKLKYVTLEEDSDGLI